MATNVLEYRGYTTFVRYSADDDCLYGKLEGMRSTILFDDSGGSIVDAFHEAVDEYLADCAEEGIEPEKPYKGAFNVRVSPELHRRAAIRAELDHTSLNRVTEQALAAYV